MSQIIKILSIVALCVVISKRKFFFLFLFFKYAVFIVSQLTALSAQRCHVNDDICLKQLTRRVVAESFRDTSDLPDLVPFRHEIPLLVSFVLKFQKGTEILGIPSARVHTVSGFEKDPQGKKLKIHVKIPEITIQGPYTLDVIYLGMPHNRYGNGKMTFTNLDYHLEADTLMIVKKGKSYMSIQRTTFTFTTQG